MKIFSFSDLNGKIENLDIFEDEGLLDVDIILFSGGFLSSFANLQNARSIFDYTFNVFSTMNFYYVFSKTDLTIAKSLKFDLNKYKNYVNGFDKEMYIHNKVLKTNGLRVGGLDYIESLDNINENVFDVDIFISNMPPAKTILDKTSLGINAGSEILKQKILQYQPKIWLCGYVKEGNGNIKLGNTQVFNVSSAENMSYKTFDL